MSNSLKVFLLFSLALFVCACSQDASTEIGTSSRNESGDFLPYGGEPSDDSNPGSKEGLPQGEESNKGKVDDGENNDERGNNEAPPPAFEEEPVRVVPPPSFRDRPYPKVPGDRGNPSLDSPEDPSLEREFQPSGPSDPVPEPSTLLLLGAGVAGLALIRKRRKSSEG